MKPEAKLRNEVAHRRRAGDIAAHHTERLGQGALDHGEAVHQPLPLGDAAAARTVEPDGVDLVEIGHGAMLVGDVADLLDRRDIAVHRIDRLEGDEFGTAGLDARELAIEVLDVVVLEHEAFGAAVADAFDHRGVVRRVREDDAARQARRQRP